MSGLEPIATAALTKAIDFLFDEAVKILDERRESRRKRGEDETSVSEPNMSPTKKEEVLSWQPKNVYLKDVPREVKHCLDMIEQYRTNKRYTESTIAHFGGFQLAPISVRNELRSEEDEINTWVQRLKDLVETVYGHKITIVGLD